MAFSDYRVQDIGLLYEFIKTLNPRPDLILYGGDDTERFRLPTGINWFECLASLAQFALCGVIGNDCRPSYRRMLSGTDVYNVHKRPVIVGDYAVIGMEGAVSDPAESGRKRYLLNAQGDIVGEEPIGIGYVLYPEPSIRKHLLAAKKAVARKKIIVLSHCPPHKVLDLAQRFGWDNIGSSALRDFVKKTENVVLVVCGHVHRCGEKSAKLGSALVVNAASHDDIGAPGRVAIIEIRKKGRPEVEWRLLPELTSIPGIGETRAQLLRNGGVAKVEDLARAEPHLVHGLLNCGISIARQFIGRAQALLENKPVVLGPLQLPAGEQIFLDIETDHVQSYIWLIGVYSERDGSLRQFFAEHPQKEREILEAFVDYAEQKQRAVFLSVSGSHFDRCVILNRLKEHGLSGHFHGQIEDIYQALENCVALPICTLQLKDVAACLGFQYRHPDLSGKAMPSEYEKYMRTRKPSQRNKLLEYNEDDVMSMRHVVRRLIEICSVSPESFR
ncbi:MAG: TM0106 family RecB-like putative nuclease [Acidobacteria bacterium]|nr:TM0106 family RecB-like putative nuclease [Acidobacteriota bacterium]